MGQVVSFVAPIVSSLVGGIAAPEAPPAPETVAPPELTPEQVAPPTMETTASTASSSNTEIRSTASRRRVSPARSSLLALEDSTNQTSILGD